MGGEARWCGVAAVEPVTATPADAASCLVATPLSATRCGVLGAPKSKPGIVGGRGMPEAAVSTGGVRPASLGSPKQNAGGSVALPASAAAAEGGGGGAGVRIAVAVPSGWRGGAGGVVAVVTAGES